MRIRKKTLLFILISMAIPVTGLLNPARAQSYSQIELDPKRVLWTQLSYHIKNFSAEVNAQVRLESLPAEEVEAVLIKSPQSVPIKAMRPESYKISVDYAVDSIFKPPVETINNVWFNPVDATALGRIRLRRGNADFKKVYRFTEQGVFRHQREPRDPQETSKEPENWTDIKDSFYPYDRDQLGCPNVTERMVLIYIASAAEISKDTQPQSFCVFGRRQLFQVWLKPQGFQLLEVDFIEKKKDSKTRRQGEVEALKIALEIEPLASNLKKVEDFSFLGFQKDIAIFVDPVSTIPIQISGEIPWVGKVTIKLREAQLR
jgi:hypothetical protein